MTLTDSRIDPDLDEENRRAARIEVVAQFFVASGRVVPGLVIEPDGRARSQWWPLPVVDDRELIASLLQDDSPAAHAATAAVLAERVDQFVRSQLAEDKQPLVQRRSGRRTIPEAWLLSLTAKDPWLPASFDPAKLRAFAAAISSWVQSGAVPPGRVRLCLRVHEPMVEGDDRWPVELLAQDTLEASLMTSLHELWKGSTLFQPGTIEEVLTSLGRLVRVAPELSAVLDSAVPTGTELSTEALLAFARNRIGDLADVGIAVLLPSWWTRTGRVGLRAKASSKHTNKHPNKHTTAAHDRRRIGHRIRIRAGSNGRLHVGGRARRSATHQSRPHRTPEVRQREALARADSGRVGTGRRR